MMKFIHASALVITLVFHFATAANAERNDLGDRVMRAINATADVNPVNLLSTALLATPRHAMDEGLLRQQLELYRDLVLMGPLAGRVTVTDKSAVDMIRHGFDRRHADRDRDVEFPLADSEGLFEALLKALRLRSRLLLLSAQKHRELVPSKASRKVIGAELLPQQIGDADQNFVADIVAVAVVDGLEVVQIEIEQRDGPCTGKALVVAAPDPRGILVEPPSILESGQRIPSLHTFLLLCGALELDPASLFRDSDAG